MGDSDCDLGSVCEDSSGGSPRPSDPLRPATQDSSPATANRKVSLKRRAESFSAGSLLARFHSSRKSDSDIQGEGKKGTTSCSGGGVRARREHFVNDTSASLPDCLHHQVEGEGVSGSQEDSLQKPVEVAGHGHRELRGGSEDLVTNNEVEVTEEDSPFIDGRNGSGLMDNWFLTWPGRQKSLKSFMKRKKNINERKENIEDKFIKPEEIILPTDGNVSDSCGSDKDVDKVINMETKEKAGQVSLDALLESLPLVYDPTTKQLRVGRDNSFNGPRRPPPIRTQSLPCDELELEKNGYEHSVSLDLPTENESQKEFLIKQTEPCSPSYLESIQEQDESSEGARLMRACSPNSGTGVPRGHFESPRNSLPRVSTTNSLSMTDASSFSSLSSSNTELSLYSASDSAVCLGSQYSDTSSLHSFTDVDTKLKRKGITEFLSRTVFSWRHKDEGSTSSQESSSPTSPSAIHGTSSPGWKLFSRGSSRSSASPDLQRAAVSHGDLGTTGLILEGRPTSLPAKTAQEDLKHKQEYQAMVSLAKKKEVREAKERQRAAANQKRQEEQLASAVNTWNNQILPKWDTMRNHKKCRELWWLGLPSCVRGKIWKMAIGNDLNINKQLYSIMVQRSVDKLIEVDKLNEVNSGSREKYCSSPSTPHPEDHESTIDLIRLDVSRTFPHLCIFQKGGPYHDPLHHILGAYACYRPDVGYMQGMSFLAATLLLNMDESDAFTCFANLLNRTAHQSFFTVNQPLMSAYYSTYEELLIANLPGVAKHLQELRVTPDMYMLDWILTVFARSVPLDAAARIWDVYLRDGEEFLFRAAIGIMKLYCAVLTEQECTTTAAQFLTRLPDNLCTDSLFTAIQAVRMTASKRTFTQILQYHMSNS